MALFSMRERRIAGAIAGIAFGNPFLPERIMLERRALGGDFVESGPVLRVQSNASYDAMFPNVANLHRIAETLAEAARRRLSSGIDATEIDLALYEDVVCYVLYNRHLSLVQQSVRTSLGLPDWRGPVERWPGFLADFQTFLELPDRTLPFRPRPEHLFAVFFQIARAFHSIFENIVGASSPTFRLRAAVWQSIFTHDMRRYINLLYNHMMGIATLITGPTGSGKELVARAVGQSLYTEFDPKGHRFAENRYSSLNLSAFAPTLIESELFGSVRGAFSGATDRVGWLEECGSPGAVNAIFLDEIGELDEAIQVKLLRVFQDRKYTRVGETRKAPRVFQGKVIAATNRDLAAEMRQGRFRPDFYYRLCADVIKTPELRDQLADRPEDLPEFVRYVVRRRVLHSEGPGVEPMAGAEVDSIVDGVVEWIGSNLEAGYCWPGNFRELEQCVRNLMIRNHYQPPGMGERERAEHPNETFVRSVSEGSLTSDGLLAEYYALVLRRTGSLTAASKQLGIDWRTLKKRIGPEILPIGNGPVRGDPGA
jgi:DNA-binding NtrC family response regulator